MRRIAAFTTALALLGIWASAGSIAAQESSVVGAWITTSWERIKRHLYIMSNETAIRSTTKV